MASPSVAVVIVNWNGREDTVECLASLAEDQYTHKSIIVVDNGSSDGSAHVIQAAFSNVCVLKSETNLGFTGGNNLALRHPDLRESDYIFMLNNDTTVEPDTVSSLVESAEKSPQFGLLSPVIHYYDHRQHAWFAGSSMDLARGTAVHDNSLVPPRGGELVSLPWLTGCALFARSKILNSLEGLDDRYYLNWEDVDLSMRVRASGLGVGLVPRARIYHKVSRSFRKLPGAGLYYHLRNNLLFLHLHGGDKYQSAARFVIWQRVRESIRGAIRQDRNACDSLRIIARAAADHRNGRYGKLCIRAREAQLFGVPN